MSFTNATQGVAVTHDEKGNHEVSYDDTKGDFGNAVDINARSVALAAAVEAQKPSLLSKNMLKLYFIMSVGYLVSTMNGFGIYHLTTRHKYFR